MSTKPIFRNYKGFDQLQIETVEDLERLETLDKARWAATSVPCEQLFCDPGFLSYMDLDKNGRIRINEMLSAHRWLWERLKNRQRVAEASDELFLGDLNTEHPESKKMRDLAIHLLEQEKAENKDRIKLSIVRKHKATYSKRFPNGDGIVTKSQAQEHAPTTVPLLLEIIALTKGVPDLSGELGVRSQDLDAYVERGNKFLEWHRKSTEGAGDLSPFGEATESYAKLVNDLAPKVSQFFSQCALVSLEAAALTRLQASPEELKTLDVSNTDEIEKWLAKSPLSRPNSDGILSLEGALNPRYSASLQKLAKEVGPKALGQEAPLLQLNASQWAAIQGRFAAYNAWKSSRPEGFPPNTNPEQLKANLQGEELQSLRALIARDQEVADELVEFNNLEKLILFQCWYIKLANNLVSFPALFIEGQQTLFEMGTLVLDGRKMRLCVKVVDKAAHKAMAESSLMFLAYADLFRKEGDVEQKAHIAVAVTAGVKGGIAVNKRGVFYDRDGKEWDAIVTDLIEQPISVTEAMWAPFTRLRDRIKERLRKLLESKAESFESKATEATEKASEHATTVVAAATTAPPKPPAAPATPAAPAAPAAAAPAAAPAASGNNLQALVLGGGIVFAAIGSTFAFLISTLTSITLKTLFGLFGLVFALAGLFGLLGFLKLRKRDISTLLEACGWALNGRMRLTHTHSLLFTLKPGLPKDSIRKRQLPSGRARWIWLIVGIILLALIGLTIWKPTFFIDLWQKMREPDEAMIASPNPTPTPQTTPAEPPKQ